MGLACCDARLVRLVATRGWSRHAGRTDISARLTPRRRLRWLPAPRLTTTGIWTCLSPSWVRTSSLAPRRAHRTGGVTRPLEDEPLGLATGKRQRRRRGAIP
jgi:hypothetical protein